MRGDRATVHSLQERQHRVVAKVLLADAREYPIVICAGFMAAPQKRKGRRRERYAMLPTRLDPLTWDRPNLGLEVDFRPSCAYHFAGTGGAYDEQGCAKHQIQAKTLC
jgi:hypothetical protein